MLERYKRTSQCLGARSKSGKEMESLEREEKKMLRKINGL